MIAALRAQGDLASFVRESPIHRPPLLAAVQQFATDLPAGARVLDAGAGQCPYRELFADCEYVTHDWPASPHARAADADVVGDLCNLPVEDGSFDAALCTEVLEHVATPDAAVAELFRILRPGGALLVTVPFVAELHEEPHDHLRYTSYGISGLLERAGFQVDSIDPLTGYFSTLAHILRVGGLSIRSTNARPRPMTRMAALILQAVSLVFAPAARALDRLDEHAGLPIGWAVRGSVPRRG